MKFNKQLITNVQQDEWTMVITPKRKLFEIDFKELWRYRDLIFLFFRRDFVAKYKQTILGPAWFIIRPLLTTMMYTIVFGNIAGISTDGLPKMLFYMAGTVAWTYFAETLKLTGTTFKTNEQIFGKVYFPRLTVPISISMSNLITFGIQFLLLLGIMIYFGLRGASINPNINILILPYLILLMAALGLGFGIIISSLTTKYRDLTNLLSFGVQLWMYATPVIYPLSTIPEKYVPFILANPMTPVIETFRYALLGAGTVNIFHLGYTTIFTVVILIIGIVLFNQVEKTFMDTV